MCSKCRWLEKPDSYRSLWIPVLHPSEFDKLVSCPSGSVLVGMHEEGHRGICCKVSELSTSESQTPKVRWFTSRYPSPTWKWEDINMDFLVGLPRTQKQYHSIWVVLNMLTKTAPFILVKSTYLHIGVLCKDFHR